MNFIFSRKCQEVFLFLALLLSLGSVTAATDQPYDLNSISSQAIGKLTYYFQESDQSLTLQQALAAHKQNHFIQNHSDVLNFGIGAPPVWITVAIQNNSTQHVQRKFLIDTSWLNDIQVYIKHRDTGEIQQYQLGDKYPFSDRPEAGRTFQVDALFLPGTSDIFLRVASPDPMVIPVYLLTADDANEISQIASLSYAFGYGYLIALLAYNAMLFFALRNLRYLLYAIFLGSFTFANISYTGHAFMWIWPTLVEWQGWAQPLLMVLFGSSGLAFALNFLEIRQHASRFYYLVIFCIVTTIILLFLTYTLNNQVLALYIAFVFIFIFVLLMLTLGLLTINYDNQSARYFLLAIVAGTTGSAITAASTMGLIPFNNWSFRAVEIGMLLEATLLALALALRIRRTEKEKTGAEKLAMIDPLTELNNRRSFYVNAAGLWSTAERYERALSIIIFDLDDFKTTNDKYGHTYSDQVLIKTGALLMNSIRKGDIIARWGGEEFILLLPESNSRDAEIFAERLRKNIQQLKVACGDKAIHITASFGVAQKIVEDISIDALIARADKALYQGKENGKNQVIVSSQEETSQSANSP
jgi:diguanylate cyclase (GGDEF)-like protein